MSKLLEDAVSELSKLPSIGRRTALRLSLHMLRMDVQQVNMITESIGKFRNNIRYCSSCNNLSDSELCPICEDTSRDRTIVCVVEHIGDVMSIERTNQYKGLYHVLGGVISPMQGTGPSDLKVDLLLDNVRNMGIKEVILALGTTIEGETTQFYITRRLEEFGDIKISAIARDIGFGDELEFSDDLTIAHAINNRTDIIKYE